MNTWTDEQLMAYADGALPLPQADAIRRAAAADSMLRERIAVFAESRALLESAYAAKHDEPVPARLLALFDPEVVVAASRAAAQAPSAPIAASPTAARRRPFVPLALAASLVLALLVGLLVQRQADPVDKLQLVAALNDALLVAALETSASGVPMPDVEARREAMPLATWRDADGRYCRSFEVTRMQPEPISERGSACRSGDGQWLPQATAVASAAATDRYLPASVSATVPRQPLDPASEQRLLSRGWKP
jgi:surface antigen